MQQRSTSKTINIVHKAAITTTRTIIPDDVMLKKLIDYQKRIKAGVDFDVTLVNCSFELKSLETIQPLIESNIITTIFEEFEKFNDSQKNRVLMIIQAISTTPYNNVICSKNLNDLSRILKVMYNEQTQEKVLMILKEYLEFDESITERILKLGGMTIVIDACKSKEIEVLRHCSLIILKILLFGGRSSVNLLMKYEIFTWILPFVAMDQDVRVPYFAYFSLIYLKSIWRIEHSIFETGLMDNIVEWLSQNEANLKSSASFHCRSLKNLYYKLFAMLSSKSRMAQTFGTFQIGCECEANLDGMLTFNDEKIICELRRIAAYSNMYTSTFAINNLKKLINVTGRDIQRFPPKNISEWNKADVQRWLKLFGFEDYALFFFNVDGKALMRINENDLKNRFFIADPIKRRSFVAERSILNDESKEKTVLTLQQESILYDSESCLSSGTSITFDLQSSIIKSKFDSPTTKKYDAFISYRRQGGSELASLIFIYLKGKKYNIFFDVQSLRAGKFADKLKNSILQSQNFILLLTTDALKRCKEENDWIAIEIEMALKSGCNIIPVTKGFDNKNFEDEALPENIKKISEFNQIEWHHDTQDTCLNKISEYMQERQNWSCLSKALRKKKHSS